MKTSICLIFLLMLAGLAHAADTITLGWTAPTKLSDGTPIGTNTITYAVHDLTAGDVVVYQGTARIAAVETHPGKISAWVVVARVNGQESKPSSAYVLPSSAPYGATSLKEIK